MKTFAYTGSVLLLVLALSIPSFAQTRPPQQYKGGPAEYAEYNPLFSEKDPAKKAQLAEKFLVDFTASDYTTDVYQMLVGAYNDLQQWPKVIDAADRFEKSASFTSPFVIPANKIVIFSDAAIAAMQTANLGKMSTYVDKELAADPAMTNPSTVNMLLVLSASIPEALPTDPAAQKDALTKAFDLATKAQAAVDKLFGGAPPAGIDAAAWSGQKESIGATIHATFGLIALSRQDYEEALKQYGISLKTDSKNGTSYYRVGLAYQGEAVAASQKLQKAMTDVNAAIAAHADKPTIDDLSTSFDAFKQVVQDKQNLEICALATSVALGGPAAKVAEAQVDKLWKQAHNDSLDGLDTLINSKKSGGSGCP